ncbi:MAG: hypothetical protein GW824_08405, partial [Deltaproteobacteria bacterium]|nr:hypothetical protein [Deltaproteobacteria bacterium]
MAPPPTLRLDLHEAAPWRKAPMLLFGDRRRRRAWGLAGGALGAATLAGLVVGLLHAPPMAVDPPVVVAAGPPPRARDFPLIDKPVAPRPLPAPAPP